MWHYFVQKSNRKLLKRCKGMKLIGPIIILKLCWRERTTVYPVCGNGLLGNQRHVMRNFSEHMQMSIHFPGIFDNHQRNQIFAQLQQPRNVTLFLFNLKISGPYFEHQQTSKPLTYMSLFPRMNKTLRKGKTGSRNTVFVWNTQNLLLSIR